MDGADAGEPAPRALVNRAAFRHLGPAGLRSLAHRPLTRAPTVIARRAMKSLYNCCVTRDGPRSLAPRPQARWRAGPPLCFVDHAALTSALFPRVVVGARRVGFAPGPSPSVVAPVPRVGRRLVRSRPA